MRHSVIRYLSCLTLLFLLFSPVIISQEWPQWMGANRDGRVTGFKVPAVWPATLTQEWKVKVGTGDATPVMSGGKLFLFTRQDSSEVVICLEAATGKEIWKTTYPAPAVTGPAQSHPGPRSTPVIFENKLITFGVAGTLSCFELSSGKMLWQVHNPDLGFPQFFTGMSPVVFDGKCIIHLGTRDKGQLVAFNINSGKPEWKWEGEGPAYCSPVLMNSGGTQMLVFLTEKSLVGVDAKTGTLLWQNPATVLSRFYNASSPTISGSNIYITGQGQGTRAFVVEKAAAGFATRELWANTTVGTKWTTLVLKDGFLYGLSDQRKLFCLNAANGESAWTDQTSNHDFGTVTDAGKVMVALPASSNLIFYVPDPLMYKELARYKVADTPVFTFPVFSGNLIYIKDAEHLTAFKF